MTQTRTTLLPADQAASLVLSDIAQSADAGIVSRTLLQTPELRVVHFSLANGQELTSHSSSRRAIVQILTGACEFEFGNRWHSLPAGTVLHLPPGHPHAVRAGAGPFTMLLTLAAEPPNENASS